MNAEELIQKYDAGERDFTGIQIIRGDLKDLDLRGANFTNASFKGRVDFRGANLSGTNFTNAYLAGANLGNVDLSRANCRDVYLSGAELEEVNFTGADLTNADLSGTNLNSGVFLNANLRKTYFYESFSRGTIFYGANIDDVVIMDCTFHAFNFTKATLRRARMEHLTLRNCIFIKTDLTGASGWSYVNTDFAVFKDTILPDGSSCNLNNGRR